MMRCGSGPALQDVNFRSKNHLFPCYNFSALAAFGSMAGDSTRCQHVANRLSKMWAFNALQPPTPRRMTGFGSFSERLLLRFSPSAPNRHRPSRTFATSFAAVVVKKWWTENRFTIHHSKFIIQHSTLKIQNSTFSANSTSIIQHSKFNIIFESNQKAAIL